MAEQFSYSVAQAAAKTGLSVDVIRRAMKAGDLAVVYPIIAGRPLTKPVILPAELDAWLRNGATERAS